MAKRRVKKDVPLTRKQVSRRQKERRQRLFLIGVAVGIGCLIVAILGYGVYQEIIAKPAAPVAKVNGVPISTQAYQKRVLLGRTQIDTAIQQAQAQRAMYDPEEEAYIVQFFDQQISQYSLQRDFLNGESFVDELIQEELIRQAAAERGIDVSADELDRAIEEGFGYYRDQPTPAPSPATTPITATSEITPTEAPTPMTRAGYEEAYSEYLKGLLEDAGVTESDYRGMVRTELLRQKLRESMGQEVPTSELQIHARHILVETEEEANAVLELLNQGEDFATVAMEVSQDTGSAELGGDLGWFAQGVMVPAFDEVAFNLPVGEVSDVVETTYGFHVILVEERDEDRELDPDTLEQRISDAFDVWLLDLQTEADIEMLWSEDKVPPEKSA